MTMTPQAMWTPPSGKNAATGHRANQKGHSGGLWRGIRIPKGWRKMKPEAIICSGDKYRNKCSREWLKTNGQGLLVSTMHPNIYIRKIQRKVKR